MGLVRYNSNFNEYYPVTFRSVLDEFFSAGHGNAQASRAFTPRVDVEETGAEYQIHLAVPGINKEDFKLDVADDTLSISGERKLKSEDEDKGYRRLETQYGQFSRSFRLPKTVLQDGISANYQDGILTVRLPKAEPKALVKTIEVA